ncbi:MAG: sensor histidine kinase [Acidimicrobiales bacterium]
MALVGARRRPHLGAMVATLYLAAVLVWLVIGVLPTAAAELSGVRSFFIDVASGDGPFAGFADRVLGSSYVAKHPLRVTLDYVFALVNLGLGLLVLSRRPQDRVAQLLAVGLIGTAVTFNVPSHAFLNLVPSGAVHQFHDALHVWSGLAYIYAVVLFPDGRLIPNVRTERAATMRAGAYVGAALIIGLVIYNRISIGHPGQAFFVRLFGIVIPVAGVAAQTYRLRHVSSAEARQQSRMLRFGLLPLFATGVAFWVFSPDADLGLVVFPFVIVLVPVSIAVGILRYRLWDIDVIVNRALLVGLLVAGVVVVDTLVVIGAADVLGLEQTNAGLWVAATAVAVLALDPARARAAELASRVVYGTRTTPEEALAELTDGLAGAASGPDALRAAAESLSRATGATEVAVWENHGTEAACVARYGAQTAGRAPTAISIPIGGAAEPIGMLTIGLPPGLTLSRGERALAEEFAAHSALLLRNERLAGELRTRLRQVSEHSKELQRLRRRLLATEDQARRKLERDIHDGAQQYLVALAIQLDLAGDSLADGTPGTAEELEELMELTTETLEVVRALARGIHPRALRESGPAAALAVLPSAASIHLEIADRGLGRHDPEIEAGVYFACLEAVQNACKHAAPRRVTVHLMNEHGHAQFTIEDDGSGFDAVRVLAGGGLRQMHDRVLALGGVLDVRSAPGAGTVVKGQIPLRTLVAT